MSTSRLRPGLQSYKEKPMKEKLEERLKKLKSDVDMNNRIIGSRERPDGKTWEHREGIRDMELDEIAFIESVLV